MNNTVKDGIIVGLAYVLAAAGVFGLMRLVAWLTYTGGYGF